MRAFALKVHLLQHLRRAGGCQAEIEHARLPVLSSLCSKQNVSPACHPSPLMFASGDASMNWERLPIFLLLTLPCHGEAVEVRFNRDIQPILARNCFTCHGPDKHERKAKLRLDTADGFLTGGASDEPVIRAGNPEESMLWERLVSDDPDEIMPPPESHKELSTEEKNLIREWIQQGAKYEGHWSFTTPVLPALPAVEEKNPIDRFVASRLTKEKLRFSPEADRRTLARRLHLDLTGLPPSEQQIADFLSDKKDSAYENLVTRLLSSPHFGEQLALPWLDASRYADTNGYSIDGGRDAWLWRDWVIKAFNDNMPYDQFLIEQLAGDLLEKPSNSQLIATAYNRHHSVTHEGGTIGEENLVNYVVDRVKTTGESIMGLTTGCGQCHDHKYDPLKQVEYYKLFAFFNTLDDHGHDGDRGVNPRPFIQTKTPLATDLEVASIQKELEQAERELAAPKPTLQAQWEEDVLNDLKRTGRDFQLISLDHLTATLPNGDPNRIQVKSDESVEAAGGDFSAYNVCCRIPEGTGVVTGLRVIFEPANKGKIGFGGKSMPGGFVMSTITPCFNPFPAKNIDLNTATPYQRVTASSFKPGFRPESVHDTSRRTGWAPALSEVNQQQHLTVTFKEPVDTVNQPYLTTELVFNYGEGASPKKFRLALIKGADDTSMLPTALREAITLAPEDRTSEQIEFIRDYFNAHSSAKSPARHQVSNLQRRLEVLTGNHRIMVMNTSQKPRVTHVLERGFYADKRQAVKPGVPAFLPPLEVPADRDLNRLDLARWLVRPDHPLTSRVAVNRFWQMLFGRGIVKTSADFGTQGEWPTHPELLDWLALTFQNSGWDVKGLIRTIVTSRTYRQSSNTTAELLERDPLNEFLARGPRFRLSAEMIRDHALATSGLLVRRIGGPSVKPYHPGDLWRQVSHYGSTPATSQTYVQDHGENLYRRSIYTYWKRTLPPPAMAAFDAPNREACITGRGVTNTPLQAFILMNDPQYVEASRVLAQQLLSRDGSDQERLRRAFEHVTSRPPDQQELAILEIAITRERTRYLNDISGAQSLIAVGESLPDPTLPAAEHAAWTNICGLLLNLSESVTRR